MEVLLLVRHGIAESEILAARNGCPDEERRLTAEGRRESALVAASLRERVGAVDGILHSPFARARETAEIFAKAFPEADLEPAQGFTPDSDPRELGELFGGAHGARRLMVVSHEPYLSAALSYLLTGGLRLSSGFERSAVAGIEWSQPGSCRLLFFVSPRLLLGEGSI